MAEQVTVCSALHTYQGPDGENRTAGYGEPIELDGVELERALALGAVTLDSVAPLTGPVVEPVPPVPAEAAGKLLPKQGSASTSAKSSAAKDS